MIFKRFRKRETEKLMSQVLRQLAPGGWSWIDQPMGVFMGWFLRVQTPQISFRKKFLYALKCEIQKALTFATIFNGNPRNHKSPPKFCSWLRPWTVAAPEEYRGLSLPNGDSAPKQK